MSDSKKIDDGGTAFSGGLFEPQHGGSNDREPWNHGMSLRDWFAGQALAGMLAMPEHDNGNFHNNCGESFIGPAQYAYRMADAMIAARKGGG